MVIENVRGLLSAPYPYQGVENLKVGALALILERLEQAGYVVSFNLYNTANFGVPQIRECVVILAKLKADSSHVFDKLPLPMQQEVMGAKLKLGGGKTGFFRRLSWEKPSPTLVTNPTMPATDLCHPTLERPLSVEEYAAIQEFPQNWKLCGPILEQYRQLGNAVPIGLGQAIALTLQADMRCEQLLQYSGFAFSRYKNTDDVTWRCQFDMNLFSHSNCSK